MPTVHVFGAAGFAGAQLAALIDRHPGFDLGVITARGDAGKRLVDVAPEYRVTAVLEPPDPASVAPGDFAAVPYGGFRRSRRGSGGLGPRGSGCVAHRPLG